MMVGDAGSMVHAPAYNLLKHPRMLARALQSSVSERIRS
jgi:hypothetical protein